MKKIKVILFASKSFVKFAPGGSVIDTVTLAANQKPQESPEWVKDTPTFKYGVQDGTILELASSAVIAETKTPEPPAGLDEDQSEDEPVAVGPEATDESPDPLGARASDARRRANKK